jgi:hypothetical protein
VTNEPGRVADSVAVLALLDFLLGDSLADIATRHRLHNVAEVEALLRSALLSNGYTVRSASERRQD